MPPRILDPIYAEEDEKGDWVFGFNQDDFDLIRQGYACGQCLEVFAQDNAPISLFTCPMCHKPTALQDPVRAITATPQDWVDYLKKRDRVLNEPSP